MDAMSHSSAVHCKSLFNTGNVQNSCRSDLRFYAFFFFSSRRRHTRCGRDWSSDVCSSDLKQTVYRTGTDSVLMKYLIDAAQRGKEVTVVVELLARFDEEANLNWAAKLEEVGAHVVYGVVGYKTHAKMSLVVRREEGRLRRYAHVSTGNYHPRTARLYTDFGLLTADEKICEDVNEVFKQLTGLGRARRLHYLWI